MVRERNYISKLVVAFKGKCRHVTGVRSIAAFRHGESSGERASVMIRNPAVGNSWERAVGPSQSESSEVVMSMKMVNFVRGRESGGVK